MCNTKTSNLNQIKQRKTIRLGVKAKNPDYGTMKTPIHTANRAEVPKLVQAAKSELCLSRCEVEKKA